MSTSSIISPVNTTTYKEPVVRPSQLRLLSFVSETFEGRILLDASHSLIDSLVVTTQSNKYIDQCIYKGYISQSI